MYLPQVTITIPEDQVYRYLRFQPKGTITEEWKLRIREAIKTVKISLQPKGMIQTETICPELMEKWEWKSSKFGGGKVRKVIDKSQKVTFVAATIGKGLEELIDEHSQRKEMMAAYLFDVIGTVAVHQTIEQLKKMVLPLAQKEGSHLSPRMAPGYGDWQVEAQPLFFENLEMEKLDLQLNKDGMITPKHTLTGLFAWTHQEQKLTIPCLTCSKTDCIYRLQQ
ncbi:hypothetical protein [Tepidibacillus marianensis]|uniref:hypothetical protein n=1 Tax=Tepidibacillus marianensis TaxID=3131995 RepID=UPI0030CC1B6E